MYSRNANKAFTNLLIAFALVCAGLVCLNYLDICHFEENITTLDSIIFSLPLTAIYIVVFFAAVAGYARAKYMLDELPLNQRLQKALETKSIQSGDIQTKIRSGAQLKENNTFSDALQNLVSSRISIVAVVDENNIVKGVITATDLLIKMQEVLKDEKIKMTDLAEMKVSELHFQEAISVGIEDDLQAVVNKMRQNQVTKLIVNDKDNKFSGTIDALDLLSEIFDVSEGKSGAS